MPLIGANLQIACYLGLVGKADFRVHLKISTTMFKFGDLIGLVIEIILFRISLSP